MSASALNDHEPRKFLVVDDHAGFRKLVREMLVRRGGVVVECVDGADALAAFETEQPDWVLMDVEMPGMDGLTATRALRARHPCARIFIVTSHDTAAFLEAAVDAGAEGFVPKEDLAQLIPLLSNLEVRHADGEKINSNQ